MVELERLGWRECLHDVRCLRVQVDILARAPDGTLTLVEVKTRSALAHVSRGQLARLRRVARFLAQFEPIEMRLALVDARGVQLLPLEELTAFLDVGHWRG